MRRKADKTRDPSEPMPLDPSRPVRIGTAPRGAVLCGATGKWGYPDQEAADAAMETYCEHAKERDWLPVASYRCAFCDTWHLTSREQDKAA